MLKWYSVNFIETHRLSYEADTEAILIKTA